MRRIVVGGGPGNGKTTLARELADGLGLTHIEMDSLFHVTDWESATPDEFRRDLVAAMDAAGDGWVTCGNYLSIAEDLHIERADTLVWLDLPRRTITGRVVRRTVRRMVTREPLYGNGIREPMSNLFRWDPERNIIRWAWHHHPIYRVEYARHLASPEWRHLEVHHLTTPDAIDAFRTGIPGAQG